LEFDVTIGFIGLGRMGRGMARNVCRSGTQLVVYDTNVDALRALAADGAEPMASAIDVARRCDLIFTSLPGPPEFEQAVLGPGGVAEALRPGTALFDLSTNSLSVVRRAHEVFAAKGAAMLDAPVSGGPAGAASGELVIWVGGERAVYDRHAAALQTIGKAVRHVGPIGAGTVTKLMHNLLGYTIMLAEAEIFSVAVKAGMDPLDLWEALRLGLVGKRSPLDMLTNQFLPGAYETPAFALKLGTKDATLATDLGRELGVAMRLGALTQAEMTDAVARGLGEQDSRAFLKLQLERAGVTIAVDPTRLQAALKAAQG
jgi:3-hydroxyisobutyrate dehydrogenase